MTKKKQPGTMSWQEAVALAEHVRKVLVDNGQTMFTSYYIDPYLESYRNGVRDRNIKGRMIKDCEFAMNEYKELFFPEDEEVQM